MNKVEKMHNGFLRLGESKREQSTSAGVGRWLKAALVLLITGLVTGCATSRQAGNVTMSGFLGDYSQLQKGNKEQAAMVYMNSSANWAKYTKVQLVPVQLWMSDDPHSPLGKMNPETQQRLINLLHTAVAEELRKDYEIVEQPGPDVLVIRGAITEARPSKAAVNLVSTVYLPLKAVSFGKQSLTGTGIGVGAVTVEVELLDGQSQQRLAAAVDRRSGTKALSTKFDGTWGDVKLSFEWWAQRLRTRLAEERFGKPVKTDL